MSRSGWPAVEREPARERFATTRWNLVLRARPGAAQTGSDATQRSADDALAELCRQYWYPVYAFIRRGRSVEDARDLTQSFMLSLIEKNTFAQADPARGRFRSWLLGVLEHFLSNRHKHDSAKKRSPRELLSIDALLAEQRFALEPRTELTPERMYDRTFSLCVLGRAINKLGEALTAEGHEARFDAVKRLLPGPQLNDAAYAPIAASLGVTPNHFKKIVFDYRARFRQLLDAEIAELVEVAAQKHAALEAGGELERRVAEEREFLARALSLPGR